MILIKAEIKGEPDVPPFTKFFEYPDESDEQIFFSSLELIKEKLSKNLRINTNESLALYCGYVVNQLRARRSIDSIENNAAKILEPDKVMIGVPETLRKISFEVVLDNLTIKKIFFTELPATKWQNGKMIYLTILSSRSDVRVVVSFLICQSNDHAFHRLLRANA